MKKILLSAFAFTSSVALHAQCNELFISEYVEGTSNNKAIEIYNPSNSPIVINNNYRLTRFDNGSSEAVGNANTQAQVMLPNVTIQPHQAYVIALDKRDPNGTGQEAPIWTELNAVADTFLCAVYNTSSTMYFNGNDAVSLQKTTDGGTSWQHVDIFAQIGDAGMTGNNGNGGWTDAFPYNNGTNGAPNIAWTLNHTLVRKASVQQGVTTNPNPFIVSQEWDSLGVNTFDSLGTHTCTCPPLSVNELEKTVSVKMFPNPVNDNRFTVVASEKIVAVKVFTATGQEVVSKEGDKTAIQMTVETGDLAKGIYIVKVVFANNLSSITKLSVQ